MVLISGLAEALKVIAKEESTRKERMVSELGKMTNSASGHWDTVHFATVLLVYYLPFFFLLLKN